MSQTKARRGRGSPVIVEEEPFNAETPEHALSSDITPTSEFYVRNHFEAPKISLSEWRLRVTGAVRNKLTLSLGDVKAMKRKTSTVTLECAGNSRRRMRPTPGGTPWGDGAVGTNEWTGVPFAELLRRAGPKRAACEVVFRGADSGDEGGRKMRFERSLPLKDALSKEVLLAFGMNGRPLPILHGYPLRLVVPGWYGMASVKWLEEVEVVARPFKGWFQSARYVYTDSDSDASTAVQRMKPKSLIVEPRGGVRVALGVPLKVSGLAWSGSGGVDRVEFRSGSGGWRRARLDVAKGPYAWRRWSVIWVPKRRGTYNLASRAFDGAGDAQPLAPVWNLHGYGYNTVTKVSVRVA